MDTFVLNASNLHVSISGMASGIRVTVTVFGVPVDRTEVAAWGLKLEHGTLAKRLKAAILAGAVLTPASIKTDVNGNTYVSASSRISGRHLNADLKKLGF